jgi:hypothetical protein
MRAQLKRNNKPQLLLFTGAGFSAHAGAPIMADFIAAAEDRLPEELLCLVRAAYYFTGYALQADENLETAYGAMMFRELLYGPQFRVATQQQIGGRRDYIPSTEGPTVAAVIDGLERAIAEIYGQPFLAGGGYMQHLDSYREFFQYLLQHFELGVVTTNYDLVTEEALKSLDCPASYAIRRPPRYGGGVPVLKLHGSVNWPQGGFLDLTRIPSTHAAQSNACLLPPTWNKRLNADSPFAGIWNDAVTLLQSADAILIVGHSFPKTDLHLRYFFAEGLARRVDDSRVKRVTVVDANEKTATTVCEAFKRYQTVLSATPLALDFDRFLGELQTDTVSL